MGLTLKGSAVLVWSLGLHPVGHLINTSGKMRAQVYVVSSVEPVRLQAVAFWTSRDVQHHWDSTGPHGKVCLSSALWKDTESVKFYQKSKQEIKRDRKSNLAWFHQHHVILGSNLMTFTLFKNIEFFFHLRQRLESKSGDLCVAFKTFLFYLFITLSLKMFPLSLGLCEDSSFINLIIRIIFIGRTCTYTPT